MEITIRRRGTVRCRRQRPNQCVRIGHRNYEYEVEITNDGFLVDGYVIEHSLVHDVMVGVIDFGGSCEEMVLNALEKVEELLRQHRVTFRQIQVRVSPGAKGVSSVTARRY